MKVPEDRYCPVCRTLVIPGEPCKGCAAALKREVVAPQPLSERIKDAFRRSPRLRKILDEEKIHTNELIYDRIAYNKVPELYLQALKNAVVKGIMYYKALSRTEVFMHPYVLANVNYNDITLKGVRVSIKSILSPNHGDSPGEYLVRAYQGNSYIEEMKEKIKKQEIFEKDLPVFAKRILVPSDFNIDMTKVPDAKNIDELCA